MSVEQVESQQSFLQAARAELGMTWNALEVAAGIEPRALKNYRMPDGSQNQRGMPKLARRAIEQLLFAHEKKITFTLPTDNLLLSMAGLEQADRKQLQQLPVY